MVRDCGPVDRVLWVVRMPDGSCARSMGANPLVSAITEKAGTV